MISLVDLRHLKSLLVLPLWYWASPAAAVLTTGAAL
jgi:hypothetical protein